MNLLWQSVPVLFILPKNISLDKSRAMQAVRIADHPQQHTIQNIMVDLCNAESVVIVNDRIEARNLLNGPFGQQGVVRNTWTKEGRRMYKTGSTITEVPERRDVRPHLRK